LRPCGSSSPRSAATSQWRDASRGRDFISTSAEPSIVARLRAWLTIHHLSQLALLIQQVIIVRVSGEYLRLKGAGSPALSDLVDPLFISLGCVGAAAIASLLLYFNRRERTVLILTFVGIAGLIAYKLIAMPGLG
jgi:hypothetical protein